ncbi:MAG: trypsin-like serine protease [Helicobacteraceae bacterium]|nr:trypsin-like serine protease [Helicobacteraceae bacterium]
MHYLVPLLLLFNFTFASQNDEDIKHAVVKIYSAHKNLDYLNPWNVTVYRSSGSGAIIDGNRILTNAHVVANTTFIEVKHFGETKRYKAKVLAVSHQVDLALLSVEDDEFFKDITPLKIDDLPKMRQKVSIYGFPVGGATLSISDGIVSRIEQFRYKHSGEPFLGIQVDAAINPGNSGGPAISNGEIIGVVMQNRPRAQNVGFLVPTPVIKHFLKDIKDGENSGFSSLGIVTENLENRALRDLYGLKEGQSGVLVTYITYNEMDSGLSVGDIITSIDSKNIEDDGTVNFREDEFVNYKYYIDIKQIGDSVNFGVIRKAKHLDIKVKLTHQINELLLVKTLQYDSMPSYFIYGGYLFSPLNSNLLSQSNTIPLRLKRFTRDWPSENRKDIVVLVKVLTDESNRGNHSVTFWPVARVNGKAVKSFKQFKKLVQNSKEKFIVLEDYDAYKIVIDTQKAKKTEKALLERYNIQYNSSK